MKFPPWRYVVPLLILWLAFSLRVYQLDFQSIWWDEGHSIYVASQPPAQIPTLPAMDVHPPAYFILLHLWMAIAGQSEFALRYLSVIFSLLTIALLWRFAATLSPHLTLSPHRLIALPLLASLLAALSPMYVAYAQEVRSYAMITFLALASTFILWQILFTSPDTAVRGRQSQGEAAHSAILFYVILTAACLYTHYFTIFLLLFHNFAWLAWALLGRRNRISRITTWLASQLGILLLFSPQLFLAVRQVSSYTNPNLTPPTLSEFISRTWQAYTVGLTIDPLQAQWGTIIIAVILTLALLLQLLQTVNHRAQSQSPIPHPPSSIPYPIFHLSFLIGWFLIPLAAYFIILQRQPSFEPRYLILVTPALFLLFVFSQGQTSRVMNQRVASAGNSSAHSEPWPGLVGPLHLRAIPSQRLRALASTGHFVGAERFASPLGTFRGVGRLTLLAVFLISLHSYYTNETYFKDDSAGMAGWLATETTPDDLVYIDVPHPFHYYVAKGHIAAPTRYLFVDIHTAADILTREAAGRNRLYWVTWRGSDTDPRGVIPFLAQKYGEPLGQRSFRGYEVVWFSLPDKDTVFSLPTDLDPVNAIFGNVLRLDGVAYGGYPPSGSTASPNHSVWATLHFTLLQSTNIDYKVSVRLRSQTGTIAAQVDKDLLNDRHFRTAAWPLADPALNQAINVYTLPLTSNVRPGLYQMEVVVYNGQPPYPSEGVTGTESTDGTAAVIGSLTVIP